VVEDGLLSTVTATYNAHFKTKFNFDHIISVLAFFVRFSE
jgi:hypothetical protein